MNWRCTFIFIPRVQRIVHIFEYNKLKDMTTFTDNSVYIKSPSNDIES